MGTDHQVSQSIVFFDGVCNLCNSSINFIIDRDPGAKFKFAPLQSNLAQKLLPEHNIDPEALESFVLIQNGRVYRRSRAALEIARRMSGAWPLLYVFVIIPGFLRDLLYNVIAKNRYRWFGRRDSCRMPTPELSARFLD